MVAPLKTMFVTHPFGITGSQWQFGYNTTRYLSHLDFFTPILAPPFGNSGSGMIKTLASLLSIKPRHINISTSERRVPGTKGHHAPPPRLYTFTAFKSALLPSYQKSKGVFNERDGRTASYFLINQFSHTIPGWGLLKKILCFFGRVRRIYEARLLQSSEQYFRRPPANLRDSKRSNGILARQNSHNIFRLYQIESLGTICNHR